MLETHYFFTPCANKLKKVVNGKSVPVNRAGVAITEPGGYVCGRALGLEQGQYGIGPFIAIQPGTDEIIEAVGAGLMLGLRRKKGLGSFHIGLGFVVDPSVKVLGNEIEENQPLPAGETQIRFKEKTQGGILIIGSFSW